MCNGQECSIPSIPRRNIGIFRDPGRSLDAWVMRGEAMGPRREGSHNGGESDCSDRSDRMSGEPS